MVSTSVEVLLGTLAILLVLLAWKFLARKPKPRHHRYQPSVALTPLQFHTLQYLQAAFPDSAVLMQRPLHSLVSPRQVSGREEAQQAQQALNGLKVDFAVCDESGRPSYAFDLEAPGTAVRFAQGPEQAAEKNRILKSAGLRLIQLKGTPSQWPAPAEFRLKLALAALQPVSQANEPEKYETTAGPPTQSQASQFSQSSIMGMSVLMTLEGDEAETAWRAARD
jgi:hypothetical protein